jgi:hypothetical protein
MRWEQVLAVMGKIILLGLHRHLVGKSEGKRQRGRLNSRWESNIKVYLTEVICAYVDLTRLDQDTVQGRGLV